MSEPAGAVRHEERLRLHPHSRGHPVRRVRAGDGAAQARSPRRSASAPRPCARPCAGCCPRAWSSWTPTVTPACPRSPRKRRATCSRCDSSLDPLGSGTGGGAPHQGRHRAMRETAASVKPLLEQPHSGTTWSRTGASTGRLRGLPQRPADQHPGRAVGQGGSVPPARPRGRSASQEERDQKDREHARAGRRGRPW